MGRFLARRALLTIPVLLGVSLFVFLMIHLLPGDPVTIMTFGASPTPKQVEALREQMGLNDPLHIQYLKFISKAVTGDFGRSIRSKHLVINDIKDNIGPTMVLTGAGMLVAMVVGFGLGLLAALRRNTWVDTGAMTVALAGVSMPSFWLGILLIYFFAVKLDWFPLTGNEGVSRLVLPAIALGWGYAAITARLIRANLIDVMGQDYILTARSKGLSRQLVIGRHAMKNALIPVITIIGLQFGNMLAGAVVIEVLFARQGIGRLLVDAILQRDFPLVQAIVLFIAVFYVISNLLADTSYAFLDPRIRYE
jgi:ABC-type dipeptide/oligopeptide/nickel transport system permease component